MRKRPFILVTNDDGIDSPGISALARAMLKVGDVAVIAPISEQSAVGHAITIHGRVHAHNHLLNDELSSIKSMAVTGTPADCMKLALNSLLSRHPDLVVSGINRGANTAVNVIYSGTVSAAMESSLRGIGSMAFSLVEGGDEDYAAAARFAHIITDKVLHSRLPRGVMLNVNVPPLPFEQIKGIAVTRLARAHWEESFIERKDQQNMPYFTYQGVLVNRDEGNDTDLRAINNGYVSVTPIQHDLTAHGCLSVLGTWRWS